VDVTLVEGAVANEEHLEFIRRVRARTRRLVAFGDCAVTGNVTALRNLFSVEDILQRAYRESAVVVGVPEGNSVVPKLLDRVCRVQDVVAVDYFLPGCPPSPQAIFDFIAALLAGKTPPAEGRKFGT